MPCLVVALPTAGLRGEAVFVSVRKERQLARSLDGLRHLALMAAAVARLATAADLALVGDVPPQDVDVLVVHLLHVLDAECTHTPPREVATLLALWPILAGSALPRGFVSFVSLYVLVSQLNSSYANPLATPAPSRLASSLS
jgi:hypothetical protein